MFWAHVTFVYEVFFFFHRFCASGPPQLSRFQTNLLPSRTDILLFFVLFFIRVALMFRGAPHIRTPLFPPFPLFFLYRIDSLFVRLS